MKDEEEQMTESGEEAGEMEDVGEKAQPEGGAEMTEDGEEKDQLDGGAEMTLEREEGSEGKKKEKITIPGIIYLGHIPPRFRPRHIRNMMSAYGEVGRIFLQEEERFVRKKKKKAGNNSRDYVEGWVEFRDKRVAKLVAASLNSTPMGTRKRSRFHDDLWNMKYLHRFRWGHLSERLAIERQMQKQRMRTEVSQAKKETDFYMQNVDRSKTFAKAEKKAAEPGSSTDKEWNFTQRKTEEEIQILKSGTDKKRIQKRQELAAQEQEQSQTNRSLLYKIFNAS